MKLARGKKRHQRGCGPFVYDHHLPAGTVKNGNGGIEYWCLTEDPVSTLGRLMYAIPSASRAGAGLRSAIEGSGVVIRNEEMYLVSAISSCSKITSRSSISRARRRVSLNRPQISDQDSGDLDEKTYTIVKRLEMSTSGP